MKYDFDKFLVLMKQHNETFSSLARVCGGRPSTFTDWRAQLYDPKVEKLAKIAKHWGMSTDALLDQISIGNSSASYDFSSSFQASEEESTDKKYYFDDETAAIAEEIFKDSNLRALFDAARGTKPEEMRLAADMLTKFKEKSDG